jgi:hypothetical protein
MPADAVAAHDSQNDRIVKKFFDRRRMIVPHYIPPIDIERIRTTVLCRRTLRPTFVATPVRCALFLAGSMESGMVYCSF